MEAPHSAVPICALCGRARSALHCLAREGTLVSVCTICYCSEEIRSLGAQLDEGQVHDTISEGLQALYQLAKAEVEKRAPES